MDPTGTRTKEAVAWIESAPAGEVRTQTEAARRFGITQAVIAGYIARKRPECPTCGQKIKSGAVLQTDEKCRESLRKVVQTYAWHLGDCPAYDDGDATCECGFGVYLKEVG